MENVKISVRTVTEEELKKEKEQKENPFKEAKEEFVYPDGSNVAWIVGGVNGWGLFRIATRIGRVPDALSSLYTSHKYAKEAILAYFDKLKAEENNGAKDGANKRSILKGPSDGNQRSNVSA